MIPKPAETEARAKIIWGEDPESVQAFLRGEGYSPYEARDLVMSFQQERRASLRKEGIKKVALGTALLGAVISAGFFVFSYPGYHLQTSKVIAGLALAGAYGSWKLIDGATLMLAPGITPGDLAARNDL